MVSPPTLQRHELAKSIHATFLYPTSFLPADTRYIRIWYIVRTSLKPRLVEHTRRLFFWMQQVETRFARINPSSYVVYAAIYVVYIRLRVSYILFFIVTMSSINTSKQLPLTLLISIGRQQGIGGRATNIVISGYLLLRWEGWVVYTLVCTIIYTSYFGI